MKRRLSFVLALTMVAACMSACGGSGAPATTAAAETEAATEVNQAAEETEAAGEAAEASDEGKVFNIYAWNEEFKGFFEKYYADKIPADVEVKWTIVPSDNGAYQEALDAALLNQESAADDEKVDLFLAEADYILKYTNTDLTQDISGLGVTDFSNAYAYTVEAASDANGVVKGVSFQCCPSALIYRRSIAKEVLGTDDPEEVQAALDSWDKFDAAAATAAEKGYLMTPSYAETFRVFSNNATGPWVDDAGNLTMNDRIVEWMDQAETYVQNGYTLTEGIWDAGKNAEMGADGKAMCFFGPAWYFNFCMGPAQEEAMGDWAIVEGPEAHFWGGTWLLAPTGSDNPTILGDVMNSFINDEELCTNLVLNEAQFSNNQKVNETVAADPEYASEFLGGQNDVAIFCELAKNIKFQNITIYDQLLNEGLQTYYVEYLKGSVDSRDAALANFYTYINEKFPEIVTP